MEPRIESLKEKKLIGIRSSMSVLANKTGELWAEFGPRIKDIKHRLNTDKISLQVYSPNYFQKFDPSTSFEKWALVEVSNWDKSPVGLEKFTLKEGLYAVFHYKGNSADPSIFQYIYAEWIPNSTYELDDRPHFEVLGEKYKNNHPDSEEEIWIPIKEKV